MSVKNKTKGPGRKKHEINKKSKENEVWKLKTRTKRTTPPKMNKETAFQGKKIIHE